MSQNAKVLKSNSLQSMLSADQFNYEDLQQRCEKYLDSVREQTQQMLMQAQSEVKKIKQQAKQQGREEGIAQGLQEAEKQNAELLQQKAKKLIQNKTEKVLPLLQQATGQLEHEVQACLSRWETQAIELVLAVAEKVIHRSFSVDPGIVKDRIEEVLKLTVGNSQVVIRVAEQDLESLDEYYETVISQLSQQADIKLIADESLVSGDVVVSTEHGVVDARLETQLNRIAEELLGS